MDICTPAPGLPVLRAASERVVPQTSAYLQWLRASEQERPGGAGGSTHRLPLPLPLHPSGSAKILSDKSSRPTKSGVPTSSTINSAGQLSTYIKLF